MFQDTSWSSSQLILISLFSVICIGVVAALLIKLFKPKASGVMLRLFNRPTNPEVFRILINPDVFLSPQSYSDPTQRYSYPTHRYSYPTQRYSYLTQRYSYPTQCYSYPTQRYSYPTQRYSYLTQRYSYLT